MFRYAYDGNPICYVEGFTSPTKEGIVIRKAKFELIKSSLSKEDSLSYIKSINNDEKYVDKVYSDKRTPLLFNKKFDSVQKVFILQNRQTQSSGELFILAINGSKKVITVGQNTRGVVDYGGAKLIEWDGFGINLSPVMCDFMNKYSLETVGIPPNIKFENINDLDSTIDFLIKRYK